MLIQVKCSECNRPIGVVQYSNHYFCEINYGYYVCIDCHRDGKINCRICGKKLKFHNAADTIKWQKDNNILF